MESYNTMAEEKTKYKLDINEKFNSLSLLPKEGNFIEMKIASDFKDLIISEIKDLEGKGITFLPNGGYNIEKKINVEKDIEISPALESMIKKKLNELNNTSKLTSDLISLYEKFIVSGK